MKKIILTLVVTICSLLDAGTAKLDEEKVNQNFKFQQTPVWCWAATIQMSLKYYGFDISQQEIVARTFGQVIPTTGNWMQMTNNLNYLGKDKNGQKVLISATVYMGSPSAESIINHLKQNKHLG